MESNVILVFGMRGTGKSYFVKNYLIPQHDRYLIYDNQGEYSEGVVFYEIDKLKEFWREHYKGKFRIIYRPINHDDFSTICDLVYLCGNMLFVVEEIDLVAGSYDQDISFQTVLKRGRHTNVSMIGISQRPFGINRTITSQAKEIYSFCQKEPRDIQYLKYYLGNEAEIIQSLPKYTALYYNYNNPELRTVIYKDKNLITLETISQAVYTPQKPENPDEDKNLI